MKIKNLILSLGMTLAFGVGLATNLGLSNKQVLEINAVQMKRINLFIHTDCWVHNNSTTHRYYVSGSDATSGIDKALEITADTELSGTVGDGLVWKQIGNDWYGIASSIVDISSLLTSAWDNIGVCTYTDGFWGIWDSEPSIVGSVNTIVLTSGGGMDVGWGNYWKVKTHYGLDHSSSYAFLQPENASYAADYYPTNPANPDGYEFEGWYTESTYTNKWTNESYPTGDVDLFAKYVAITAEFDDGEELSYNTTNSQFEAIKYFDSEATFHINKKTLSGMTSYATLDSYVPESRATSDGTNVTVISAGTYAVYLKSDDKIWIELADPTQEAYMYAGFFFGNVGCDATGAEKPSGWTLVSERYVTLSNDAKDIFYEADPNVSGNTIEQTVYWHNYAVRVHPDLEAFITDGEGNLREVARVANAMMISVKSSSSIIIIAIVASIAVGAVVGYFLLRKKKED